MLRFSVSLGFFFGDVPFLERFKKAKEAGFGAVEFFWPSGIASSAVAHAKDDAGVEVALFNMDEGDYERGERGFACVPGRRVWWRSRFEAALELAERLACRGVNVLTGDVPAAERREEYVACLVENLRWAAPQAKQVGVTLMLEPLNSATHPNYLCQRTTDVLDVLAQVGESNIALQYDIYQAQRSEGDIVSTIRAHSAQMGHVQVADAPERRQPGTGELNYPFILSELDASGYDGFVGLEYLPGDASSDPFAWLPRSDRG